jgi:hypothetical protein
MFTFYDWPPYAEVAIELLNRPRAPTADDASTVMPGPFLMGTFKLDGNGQNNNAMSPSFDLIAGPVPLGQTPPYFRARAPGYTATWSTVLDDWYQH